MHWVWSARLLMRRHKMRRLLIWITSYDDSLVIPFQHAHVDTRHSCRNKAETIAACDDTTDVYEYSEKRLVWLCFYCPNGAYLGDQ